MTNGILDSGQKIVTDGLVLNYDIAQLRSYPTTGTAITDLSGNSNNATLINGVAFNSGNGGNLLFDGVNDYVESVTPSVLQNQNFTASLWIYPMPASNVVTTLIDYNHVAPQGWVIQSEDATTNRFYYLAYYSATSYQPAGLFGIGKGLQITNNVWQKLTFIKNGTNVRGYINGVQVFSVTATNSSVTYLSNRNLRIGSAESTIPAGRYAKGNISQVQIYSRALSETEVLQNFNANRLRYGL